MLKAFKDSKKDSFLILQLRRADEAAGERYMDLKWLERQGRALDARHYESVYMGRYPFGTNLEDLYYTFNMDKPADFAGHPLSVSDIVALNQSGRISCYFVDSIGFKKLEGFRLGEVKEAVRWQCKMSSGF